MVTLELRDGSRIVGKDGTEHFKFHSEILGDFKLSAQQLTAIDFLPATNRVKVATSNRDEISADILTKDIEVDTSFGKISVPVGSLHRITILGPSIGRSRAGLVALWPAEGNGNPTVGDCPAIPMGPLGYGEGKKGQAFSFGGNGGYLLVHPDENLDFGKGDGFTFEFWMNPANVISEMLIFEFERDLGTSSGSDVGIQLGIHRLTTEGIGDGCLFLNIKDTEGGDHIFTSPPNLLKPGLWQHVALTYDKSSGVGAVYLNGKSIERVNLGVFTPQTSFQNLVIGARTTFNSPMYPGARYVGRLDEIAIYNRALSAEEVRAAYLEENGGDASE